MTRSTLTALPLLLASLLACEARSTASVSPSEPSPTTSAPAIALEVEPQRDTRVANPDLLAFAFVVEIDGRSHVVLSNAGDPAWGVGPLLELMPGTVAEFSVARQIGPELLPPELAQHHGRTLALYASDGERCTSSMGELLLVAQYGWGTEGLDLPSWDEQAQAPIEHSPEQIAQAVWTTQPLWLVAPLEHDCDALWARDAALPEPELLHVSDATNPVVDAYAQAFRASAIIPDMRARYESESAGDPTADPWSTRMAQTAPLVSSWLDARDQVRFVELEYGFDDSVCGYGFDTEHRAFTQVVEGREFIDLERFPDALAIFDLERDGKYEMIFPGEPFSEQWSLELVSDTLQTSLYVAADFVCPC